MLSENYWRILVSRNTVDDLAPIKGDDIVCTLPASKSCAATKRQCGIFKFERNLEHFGL